MPLPTSQLLRRTGTAVIAAGALCLSGPACAAWAHGPDRAPATRAVSADGGQQVLNVNMTMSGFSLPASVPAGFITFRTSTTDPMGHTLQGFQLHNGVTLAQIQNEFKQATAQSAVSDAAGLRALTRDITAVGGAMVDPATAVSVTLPLTAGTYYFFDFNALFAPGQQLQFHTLTVTGQFEDGQPSHQAEIIQTESGGHPHFVAPTQLDTADTFEVENQAPEIHEAVFQRVVPGTTDQDLQTAFNAIAKGQTPSKNPFAEQNMRGAGAMSPGRTELLHFEPSAGDYALLCFIPDDMTGIPHAFEGMHQIVHLAQPSGAVATGAGGAIAGTDTVETAAGAAMVAASVLGAAAVRRRRSAGTTA
ncbi:hypothetical protein ABIA33_006641 [Streptacidiphilus sp. MAP12-16]|uniref:hypothetical protein n=1 Tax=Streptacidiphilus sp. MAP12-16 TaxID=3156300 RepID=UPI003515011E